MLAIVNDNRVSYEDLKNIDSVSPGGKRADILESDGLNYAFDEFLKHTLDTAPAELPLAQEGDAEREP